MKLHPTLVEKLVKVYEVNSGYREEYKLKQALADLQVAVYTQTDGTQVLVDQQELQRHQTEVNSQLRNTQQQRLQQLAREMDKYNQR